MSNQSLATTTKTTWSYIRRELIPLKEHILWRIETGIIRTCTILDDGTVVTFGIWGPGDVVGKALTSLTPYQIECITPVEVSSISLYQTKITTEMVFAHLRQLEELSLIRSHKRVDVMLLKLLSWLAHKFGSQINTGHLIDLRLTHQDLADILGSTRVTITRTLSQLEQLGSIQRLSFHRIVLREEESWYYQI